MFTLTGCSSVADMRKPKLAAEIAKQLCKFHAVEIPGSKEPQLWNDLFKFYDNGVLFLTCLALSCVSYL